MPMTFAVLLASQCLRIESNFRRREHGVQAASQVLCVFDKSTFCRLAPGSAALDQGWQNPALVASLGLDCPSRW